MASPVLEIVPSQYLSASAAVLYTSGAGVTTRIDKLTVVNGDSVGHTVTIWRVPSGRAADNSTISTPAKAILALTAFNSPNEYGHYLNPGDALWAQCDTANVVSISVGGTQVTG